MKIGFLKENDDFRASIVPKNISKFIALGLEVLIETNIGKNIEILDGSYKDQNAQILSQKDILKVSDIIVTINPLTESQISHLKPNALVISFLDPFFEKKLIDRFLEKEITSLSMNLILRSTFAQKMDALSSQANLAGYAAVILASKHLQKILPMMTTPAGTIFPAKFFIIGAGVAGLQAIATAKRLGANVEAFDTREEVESQVKSLGAKFLKIDLGKLEKSETGYAKELSENQIDLQRKALTNAIKSSDVVITTAQVFSRKAPIIITKEMLKDIKSSLIIIDLAITTGGNVEISKKDEVVKQNFIKVIAPSKITNDVAIDASFMYSTNIYNLIEHMFDKENKKIKIDLEDEIIANCCLTHQKKIISKIIKKEK